MVAMESMDESNGLGVVIYIVVWCLIAVWMVLVLDKFDKIITLLEGMK